MASLNLNYLVKILGIWASTYRFVGDTIQPIAITKRHSSDTFKPIFNSSGILFFYLYRISFLKHGSNLFFHADTIFPILFIESHSFLTYRYEISVL